MGIRIQSHTLSLWKPRDIPSAHSLDVSDDNLEGLEVNRCHSIECDVK